MNRRRRVALAALALVLVLLTLAGPVAAKATKTEFEGTWEVTGFGDPDRIWSPGHPELGEDWWNWPPVREQARRWLLEVQIQTGNPLVDGEWAMLYDNHYDAEWAGPWNGTFHGDIVCPNGKTGSWDGTFTGKCWGFSEGKGGIATYRGHGSDCVDGMKISFEKYNLGDECLLGDKCLSIKGYVHDPHGE